MCKTVSTKQILFENIFLVASVSLTVIIKVRKHTGFCLLSLIVFNLSRFIESFVRFEEQRPICQLLMFVVQLKHRI